MGSTTTSATGSTHSAWRSRAGSRSPCTSAFNPGVRTDRRDAMTTIHTTSLVRRRPGRGVLALALCLPIALAGCSSLLDVNNPNSVPIEDIGDPKTAPSLANGLLSSLARAWGAVLSPYSIATDELMWIGSRDAWQYLDQGIISEPTNEFVDAAYPFLGESRWLSDTVIKQLTIFLNNTRLEDTNNLARAYLYGSITYATIGDFFQDFVIGSSKLKPAPPLGPANMDVVYATAISYATAGLALARAASNRDVDLETRLLAARARAAHARAVKALIYPPGAGVPIGGRLPLNKPPPPAGPREGPPARPPSRLEGSLSF